MSFFLLLFNSIDSCQPFQFLSSEFSSFFFAMAYQFLYSIFLIYFIFYFLSLIALKLSFFFQTLKHISTKLFLFVMFADIVIVNSQRYLKALLVLVEKFSISCLSQNCGGKSLVERGVKGRFKQTLSLVLFVSKAY